MELEQEFVVPAPAGEAWALLMDVPRVVPCMPGAELVETLGPERWRARMRVRLGPMAMAFDADVERAEADPAARRAVLAVRAREQRGRGGADARVTSSLLAQDGGGTRVRVHTAVTLSGRVAQFGRAAVGDVAAELTDRFAENLRAVLAAAPQAPPAPASGPAPALAPAGAIPPAPALAPAGAIPPAPALAPAGAIPPASAVAPTRASPPVRGAAPGLSLLPVLRAAVRRALRRLVLRRSRV